MKELLSAVYLGFLTLVFAAYIIYQIESSKAETKFQVSSLETPTKYSNILVLRRCSLVGLDFFHNHRIWKGCSIRLLLLTIFSQFLYSVRCLLSSICDFTKKNNHEPILFNSENGKCVVWAV